MAFPCRVLVFYRSGSSLSQGGIGSCGSHLAELPPALGEGEYKGTGRSSRSTSPALGLRRSLEIGEGVNGVWEGLSSTSPRKRSASEQRGYGAAVKFFPSGGHRRYQLFPYQKATPKVSELPHLSCPTATPPGPAATLEQKACAEQDPWLVLYLLLGLCLCTLICSLLLGWTHLRRKGEGVSCQASAGTCHCREDPAKGGCWQHWGHWERVESLWGAGSGCQALLEGQKAEPVPNRGGRKSKDNDVVQSQPGRGAGLDSCA